MRGGALHQEMQCYVSCGVLAPYRQAGREDVMLPRAKRGAQIYIIRRVV